MEFPLAEIILDFFDKLKTIWRGYASLDYEMLELSRERSGKLDMLINGDPVDAFSVIIHRGQVVRVGPQDRRQAEGADSAAALRGRHPGGDRQQDHRAQTTVKALRKDVLAKCYGGDITRKRKLLEKQKEGKKRMKQVGSVEIPQEAFLAVLQVD